MSVKEKVESLEVTVGDSNRLWHKYPTRILTGQPPPVGERALCGTVRKLNRPGRQHSSNGKCLVCEDLWQSWQGL